jgi:hypothetical protein
MVSGELKRNSVVGSVTVTLYYGGTMHSCYMGATMGLPGAGLYYGTPGEARVFNAYIYGSLGGTTGWWIYGRTLAVCDASGVFYVPDIASFTTARNGVAGEIAVIGGYLAVCQYNQWSQWLSVTYPANVWGILNQT